MNRTTLVIIISILLNQALFAADLEQLKSVTVSTAAVFQVWAEKDPTTDQLRAWGLNRNTGGSCTLQFDRVRSAKPDFKQIAFRPKGEGFMYSFNLTEGVELTLVNVESQIEEWDYNACASEPELCDVVRVKQRTVQVSLTDSYKNNWALQCTSPMVKLNVEDPIVDSSIVDLTGVNLKF